MADGNGWNEYQRLVLSELERLDISITRLENKIADLQTSVTILQVKASIWGGLAGLIVAAIVTAIGKAHP